MKNLLGIICIAAAAVLCFPSDALNARERNISNSMYVVGSRIGSADDIVAEELADFDFIYLMAAPQWKAGDFDLTQEEIDRKYVDGYAYAGYPYIEKFIDTVHKTGGKVLCSFPGMEFIDIASSEERSLKFARMMARLVREYDYDGIELDWEHTITEELHLKFMQKIRKELDAVSEGRRQYWLTTALHHYRNYTQEQARQLCECVDWVNIMYYDMGGGTWGTVATHNAPLDLMKQSVRSGCWKYFPHGKLHIGLASYGFYYKGIQHGERVPEGRKLGSYGRYCNYTELPPLMEKGWTEVWDDKASCPYYISPDRKEFMTLENHASMDAKLEWIKEEGFSGVFWWEYSCDWVRPSAPGVRGRHLITDYVTEKLVEYNRTAQRLSALPSEDSMMKIPLSGVWDFCPAPGHEFWKEPQNLEWSKIEVPGEWVMQGFEVEKGKAAGYFRKFLLPEDWDGSRIKLRCNGIYSHARVFVNGFEAGSHLGGFTAFELDVTEYVRPGKENEIAVSVVSETLADSLSSGSQYAAHPLGGITRDIFLYALPQVNLSMFHVSTGFDEDYEDAVLTTEVEIANESSAVVSGLSLEFSLKDAGGKSVSLPVPVRPVGALGIGKVRSLTLDFDVESPEKWDTEHPVLYTLECCLKQDGTVLQKSERRVGFRQVEIKGNRMFVNGMPVKLRGVCRHEVMPLRGRSVSGDTWRKDVELFRRANVNYIRTSHYPPAEELLEACDELGMFVEVEAPFCWAHGTPVPENMRYEALVNQHTEMLDLNRSHPSVIMWSIGNESLKFEEYFSDAARVVKEMDPTRPRIFSQWSPDADGGALEVTNHHYPGPGGPDMYRDSKRPVVFDEYCHLNAYNRFELATDPGIRAMWGPLLDSMWSDMYHSQGVLGGAIWAGIDDTFFLPDGRAVGYGTWGPVDGWRRPKPEYWGMKKAYSPVRIQLLGNTSENGIVRFSVENRHNFSNLSECLINWRAGGEQGTVRTDVAPRSEGSFEIVLPENLKDTEYLDIEVTGVRGFVVDEYRFRIRPEMAVLPSETAKGRVRMTERSGDMEIVSAGNRFGISRADGLLSAFVDGKATLKAPQLMILPLNPDGDGVQMTGKSQNYAPYNPVCTDWTAESVTCRRDGKSVVIETAGSYREAEGRFTYVFLPDGKLRIDYDFTVKKDVSPRQTGLVFTLPGSFSRLQWSRSGYWNVYPEDDIAALEGEAEAFEDTVPVTGLAGPSEQPANPWAYDRTETGSNMFRSTKTGIIMASLSSGDGMKVSVQSDGSQSVRCWTDGEDIRMLVADYNNAGDGLYFTPHVQKEYRPLKDGDRICGSVSLSFSSDRKK